MAISDGGEAQNAFGDYGTGGGTETARHQGADKPGDAQYRVNELENGPGEDIHKGGSTDNVDHRGTGCYRLTQNFRGAAEQRLGAGATLGRMGLRTHEDGSVFVGICTGKHMTVRNMAYSVHITTTCLATAEIAQPHAPVVKERHGDQLSCTAN